MSSARAGIIAATRPPSFVAPSQIAQSSGGVSTAASTTTATLPTISGGILANDLIVIWATLNKGSSVTLAPTISGYTKLYDTQVVRSGIVNDAVCFAKLAAGGETTAAITSSTSFTSSYLARIYRNVAGIPSVVTAIGQANLSGTPASNTVTPDEIEDLIITHAAVRTVASGSVSLAWGGGASDDYMTLSGRNAGLYLGQQTGIITAATHTATGSSADGAASIVLGSIVIKAKQL